MDDCELTVRIIAMADPNGNYSREMAEKMVMEAAQQAFREGYIAAAQRYGIIVKEPEGVQ